MTLTGAPTRRADPRAAAAAAGGGGGGGAGAADVRGAAGGGVGSAEGDAGRPCALSSVPCALAQVCLVCRLRKRFAAGGRLLLTARSPIKLLMAEAACLSRKTSICLLVRMKPLTAARAAARFVQALMFQKEGALRREEEAHAERVRRRSFRGCRRPRFRPKGQRSWIRRTGIGRLLWPCLIEHALAGCCGRALSRRRPIRTHQ